MTASVYHARPAREADLGEAASLLRRIWPESPGAASLLWKCGGAGNRLAGTVILEKDRRMVGFLGHSPLRLRLGGRDVPASQGCDFAILPEHRRLDAYLALTGTADRELRAAGARLSYGAANAEAAAAASLFEAPPAASWPLLVRPLHPRALDGTGLAASLYARLLSALDRAPRRVPVNNTQWRLEHPAGFDSRFTAFWQRVRDDYPAAVVRDAAHLEWRYTRHPAARYDILALSETGSENLAGYAVLGLKRRNGRLRGSVADLVTPRTGDPRALRLLLGAALDRLRERGADVAEAWAFPHTHLRRRLLARGFRPRRTAGVFLVHPLAAEGEPDLDWAARAENWFLALGDSDTV